MKRTLYFGNPAYLSTKNEQLVVKINDTEERKIPIEDIAFVVLDNDRITLTKSILHKLTKNNTAVIITNEKHMPFGWLMPLEGNSTQSKTFQAQCSSSDALKNRLWKQIIKAKIKNQSVLLKTQNINSSTLDIHAKKVTNGDLENREAQSARYYWKHLFSPFNFKRERFGSSPNNLLNYGYSLLRALVGRGLVSSGLLPSIGLHHRNQYNSFPLADDFMEPFRPFVDEVVLNLALSNGENLSLTKQTKQKLLEIMSMDVYVNKQFHSLTNAVSLSTASLARCILREETKLIFPTICP
jgi:CRISP-associated protein Cas1